MNRERNLNDYIDRDTVYDTIGIRDGCSIAELAPYTNGTIEIDYGYGDGDLSVALKFTRPSTETEKKHYDRLLIAEQKRKERELDLLKTQTAKKEEAEKKELARLMKKYKVKENKVASKKSSKEDELDFGGRKTPDKS